MDNNTRKLLGLTAEEFISDEEWLSESIVKSINSYIIKGKWHKDIEICVNCKCYNIVKMERTSLKQNYLICNIDRPFYMYAVVDSYVKTVINLCLLAVL